MKTWKRDLLSINIETLVFFCQNLYTCIYIYIYVSNSTMSISAGILEKVKSKIHSIAGRSTDSVDASCLMAVL